eukprot:CAMPEP_0116125342 /NCGR_PEP_ID=MMETSP0329-20121206/5761_1 /TAXON_ID=697910 /ORGANISM="Pseudo-nitzschia arenysensis, Strain B593" /LENGTH=373 /DNA_ID=CAMNT_0003619379 /DNA_START=405 /DNA_END=1526 /DNA_ORIENTATION=+
MPRRTARKRKADQVSDDDEWNPNGSNKDDESGNDDEPENDDDGPDPEPDSEANEPLVPLSKPKRRRKKVFVIDDVEESRPTYTRKTDNGGYSHTNLSKSKISKANSGNKPWNFGKRRSSADKAKIAAGVRARNRTILLAKLKKLGMSEEEYMKKKKEIKYLRERIRRAKRANGKHRDKKLDKKLQDAIDATNIKNINLTKEEAKPKEPAKPAEPQPVAAPKVDPRPAAIFSKDITWRKCCPPEAEEYEQSCPNGGPGGLICCEICSKKYNLLLTRTSEDVESHRIKKEAGEVTEILDFLAQKKAQLQEAVNAASKKIPPLPPAGSGRLEIRTIGSRKPTIGSYKSDHKAEINPGAWDLTSAIDLGIIGGFASV